MIRVKIERVKIYKYVAFLRIFTNHKDEINVE